MYDLMDQKSNFRVTASSRPVVRAPKGAGKLTLASRPSHARLEAILGVFWPVLGCPGVSGADISKLKNIIEAVIGKGWPAMGQRWIFATHIHGTRHENWP